MSNPRPTIVGPDVPEQPFPVFADTYVISGFGRGSTELGFPTANVPEGSLAELKAGIYYGWAQVSEAKDEDASMKLQPAGQTPREPLNYGKHLTSPEKAILPMVMSIGWNPYYKNEKKSAEVYILHDFGSSFYGASIKISVLGFIRDEQSYSSLDDLIQDIKFDCEVAKNCLNRPAYLLFRENLKG